MLENARADRDGTGVIGQFRIAPGFNVAKMRGSLRLGTKPKVKEIDAAERRNALHVACQFADDVASLGLHRREAPNSLEESLPKKPLKITDKTEAIAHPHRGESVL